MHKYQAVLRPATPRSVARALYLGSHQHKQVSCLGDTLLVSNHNAHTMRFPIRGVSRVLCSSHSVDWSGPALALCLRSGVGITWIDTQCRSIGTAQPEPDNAFA